MSLRFKLVAVAVLVELVVSALLIINQVRISGQQIQHAIVSDANELMRLVGRSVAGPVFARNLAELEALTREVAREERIHSVVILDNADRVLSQVDAPPSLTHTAGLYTVTEPIMTGGLKLGSISMEISLEPVEQAQRKSLEEGLVIAVLGLAGTAITMWLLAYWLTAPLSRLEAAALAVSTGETHVRASITTNDEVGRTATAINTMLDALMRSGRLLDRSERRYQEILETSQEGIWAYDADGRIEFMNDRACTLLGYEPDEMVGHPVDQLGRPQDRELVAQRIQRRAQGYGERTDTVLMRKDGGTVNVVMTATPRFVDGTFIGALVMVSDDSGRVEAERALQENERRLRAAIEHFPILVFALNAEGRLEVLEGGGLDLPGFKPAEAVGKRFQDVFPERAQTRFFKELLDGQSIVHQIHLRDRDLLVTAKPLLNEAGQLVRVHGAVLDVTEQVAARRELEEREARFANLAEGSLQAIMIVGLDDRVRFANSAAARMHGYDSPEQLCAEASPATLLAPETLIHAKTLHERRKAGHDGPERYEARSLRRDGTRFWTQALTSMVQWNGERVIQVSLVDISELKASQAALEEREARLLEAQRIAQTGSYELDLNTRTLTGSNQFLELFGFIPAQVQGSLTLQEIRARYLPEDVAVAEAMLQQTLKAGAGECVLRVNPPGEPLRVLHTRLSLIRDAEGQSAGKARGAVQDITRRWQAENELLASEARYRSMVEASLQGLLIVTYDDRVLYANPSCLRMFGYDSLEAMQRVDSALDMLTAESAEYIRTHRQSWRESGKPSHLLDVEAVRPDGRRVYLQQQSVAIQWEGQPAVQVSMVDVTEQKVAEANLRQALKMEAIGQLTGGVAHDFNNLLTVIQGNLELMRGMGLPDETNVLLDQVFRAATRGAELTYRLLAFSRRQALRPVPVNCNQMVQEMSGLLRRTLGETVEIETVLGGGLWLAEVDPAQLENAIVNLALNGRDAMPQGGKLTIETANARLDDDYVQHEQDLQAGQYVMITVTDTGSGMSPDIISRAFDPFFSTKPGHQGTGLGLSMVYGFIKQSGGHVRIYSEVEQGTSVRLYLPRSSSATQVQAPVRDPANAARGSGQLILVVEDDPAVREMSTQMLRRLGYTCISASDAEGARALLQEHPEVALLFADVVLPGGASGADLAREAMQLRPALKVLYTSGYTENAIIHHGRLDPGVELIEKPFRLEQLARRLRRLLSEED